MPDFPQIGNAVPPGKFLAVRKDLNQSYFTIGRLAGDYQDKDYAALEILCRILGDRLNQLDHGDIDGLTVTWSPAFGHPGLFRVTGTVPDPFLTTRILKSVFDQLNKSRTEEANEQELKTAKAAALNSMVFAFEGQFSILPRLAEYQYFTSPPITRSGIKRLWKGLRAPMYSAWRASGWTRRP